MEVISIFFLFRYAGIPQRRDVGYLALSNACVGQVIIVAKERMTYGSRSYRHCVVPHVFRVYLSVEQAVGKVLAYGGTCMGHV